MLKYLTRLSASFLVSVSFPAYADVDAFEAKVNTEDADRFVKLFEKSNGQPSAEDLQKEYIDKGSRGVEIFTPYRIVDGENLAKKIAENPEAYRRAIDVCLPIVKESSAELRAIYLAMEGLLGDPALPEIFTIFGANNSGGTAQQDAQVIGLEVICRVAESEEDIRALLRSFYAHESVHSLQFAHDSQRNYSDRMLAMALMEGSADLIAYYVTGKISLNEKHVWAIEREAALWSEFQNDRLKDNKMSEEDRKNNENMPFRRWFSNAGSPPEGWPYEVGYWVGMRIAEAYVEAADDKRAALQELISFKDPEEILTKSGYADRFKD